MALAVKNLAAEAGDSRVAGLILRLGKTHWNRKWQPIPVLWKFHGQRSLVGYSSWGHKESDMTKHKYVYTPYEILI